MEQSPQSPLDQPTDEAISDNDQAQVADLSAAPQRVQRVARGTFSIEMAPGSPSGLAPDGSVLAEHRNLLTVLHFTKVWSGDLHGAGSGIMLAGGDPATGNAGYVATEVVDGAMFGRTGTFLLQQLGDLDEGRETLHYQVVTGSATGELAGLVGVLDLQIDDAGVHHYELRATLPITGN